MDVKNRLHDKRKNKVYKFIIMFTIKDKSSKNGFSKHGYIVDKYGYPSIAKEREEKILKAKYGDNLVLVTVGRAINSTRLTGISNSFTI